MIWYYLVRFESVGPHLYVVCGSFVRHFSAIFFKLITLAVFSTTSTMVTLPVSLESSVQANSSAGTLSDRASLGEALKNDAFQRASLTDRLLTDETLKDGALKDNALDERFSDSILSAAQPSEQSRTGQLIVLSGPSGVGKGTLLSQLLARHPGTQVSVSATTRSPREGEVNGQHYYFVSHEQFHAMIDKGELLEWAEFAGNRYGTPKQPIETAIAQGQQVILEIELLGARQVRNSFPKAKQIFVLPPSEAALEERIRGRGQDSEEAIAKRLNQSKVELAAADEFDIKIVNDDFDAALMALEQAVFGNEMAETASAIS